MRAPSLDAMTTITIARRFCGPPESGNGGWTCGRLASLVGTGADGGDVDVEVTLRKPPPLEIPLDVRRLDGRLELLDGDEIVAEARTATIDIDPPAPVTAAEAAEAEQAYGGFERHEFPTCFTCGPDRAEGDGLRIFSGAISGRPDAVASPWVPHRDHADGDSVVPPEIVWAALDCPSGWSHIQQGVVAVLGRMSARQLAPVVVGEPYVVVGEATGVDGRKRFATSAVFDRDDNPVAVARATWITIG
jgi:hypothetical protein